MKYILIQNDIVHQIIDEFDPLFPDVQIEKRYSKKFLDQCIKVEDENVPEVRFIHKGNGKFEKPPKPIPNLQNKSMMMQYKNHLEEELKRIDIVINQL